MPDREKVAKELEFCLNVGKCTVCEYSKGRMFATCRYIIEDAEELLKEQEAAEPECQIIFDVPYYFCGSCKTMLNMYAVKAKYCSNCGRRVKWEWSGCFANNVNAGTEFIQQLLCVAPIAEQTLQNGTGGDEMKDIDKVIKALEDADAIDGVIKISNQFRDVLVTMLKEQKAKTGHWNGPECSCCHAILERTQRFFKYCPYCGAKMDSM